jgi:hypothetical protein
VADDPRVQRLLDEISDSGCTPEEVCGACPELLPEVRRCWRQMRAVEAELDALFPTPGPDSDPGADLPRIPEGKRRLVMAALYRSGQIREALSSFPVAETYPTFVAWGWLLRGMIEWRAGDRETARKTWDRPFRWVVYVDEGIAREQGANSWWSDWPYNVASHALRREADAMVAERAGSG